MIERLLKAYRSRRKTQQTNEEYQAELQNINSKYARVFKTQDGQDILDHMVKMNLTNSIAEQGDNLLDIGIRQGRADLVKEIITRMEYNK